MPPHAHSLIPLQDKVDASLLQLNQMQDQKSMFEEQLAQAARSTTDQRTSFDRHMAVAALDASHRKTSFDNMIAHSERSAFDQRTRFDTQMAKALLDASDQKSSFDSQMAQATLDASDMKEAYEQGALLASDEAELKRISSAEASDALGGLSYLAAHTAHTTGILTHALMPPRLISSASFP